MTDLKSPTHVGVRNSVMVIGIPYTESPVRGDVTAVADIFRCSIETEAVTSQFYFFCFRTATAIRRLSKQNNNNISAEQINQSTANAVVTGTSGPAPDEWVAAVTAVLNARSVLYFRVPACYSGYRTTRVSVTARTG